MTAVEARQVAPESARRPRRQLVSGGTARRVLSVIVMMVVWQLLSLLLGPKIVPGPVPTIASMLHLIETGQAFVQFSYTFERMLVAFALAMAGGIVVGTIMGLYRRGEEFLDLTVTVGLTIPSLCYVIIAFMWLGLTSRAAVLAIALSVFPSIAINVWSGVKAIDERLVDMAQVFQASPWKRTVRVVIPQVMPYLMAAARFGLGVVWKVAVVVELLGLSNGVGYELNYSFQVFDMAGVFAWTLFLAIVMIVIELLILKPIEKRLFGWRPEARR